MRDRAGRTVEEGLGRLFELGSLAALEDGTLVALMVERRGTEDARLAFDVLVTRHGPMVWGTCRLMLDRRADAEDAFQATFLVLAMRAGEVRVGSSLGGWLRGVARKVAARVRKRARAGGTLVGAERLEGAAEGLGAEGKEIAGILREEVGRLPRIYREVVTLHHFRDLPVEATAEEIGRPVGTVKGRLARARELLRKRLVRRGVSLAVPAALRRAAVDAAVGGTESAGLAAAASRSIAAAAAAKGVIQTMFMIRTGLIAAGLVVAGGGAAVAWRVQEGEARFVPQGGPQRASELEVHPNQGSTPTRSSRNGEGSDPPRQSAREFAKTSMPEYVVEPPDLIRVEVLEALPARPITGERLVRPDGKISLGYYGELYVAGLTATEIKAKAVTHLRKFLSDEALGLRVDEEDGSQRKVEPGATDRVFVEVVAYNSKVYYVQGDVPAPGRIVMTGNETVLDALNYAGGLMPTADPANIRLVRPAESIANDGDRAAVLPVDYEAIVKRGDTTTNYQIFAGDRIVVYRDPAKGGEAPAGSRGASREAVAKRMESIEQVLGQLAEEMESLKAELQELDRQNETGEKPAKEGQVDRGEKEEP